MATRTMEARPEGGLNLPDVLEYTGEFGPELTTFLPFIRWLCANDLLGSRIVRTYRGMAPFYQDLNIANYEEKAARREWVPPADRARWMPVRDEHTFDGVGRPGAHDYGDMRAQFAKLPISPELEERISEKPLLIIHNKYNDEWDRGPVNFLTLKSLDRAFARLKRRFTVVYIRHGFGEDHPSYSDDHNTAQKYPDWKVVERHPEIIEFERYFSAVGGDNVNAVKSALYARCFHFITVQGGGAAQIALFSGSLVAILHLDGQEQHWAYGPGYYTFLADPPLLLLTCSSQLELRGTLGVFERSTLSEGRVRSHPSDQARQNRLAATSLRKRLWPQRVKARLRHHRLLRPLKKTLRAVASRRSAD